jgi:pimeloyl-ACP methyl ester carboxylesterase
VSAVVSRGGRPDLAGDWLTKVQAPTLLIVGGHDFAVIDMNREAQRRMHGANLLEIVRGATHLFEEQGTLAQAARLAQSWFLNYLR